MIKNVLLLTDFSDNANNAINYAMQFFGGNTCMFYILNVHKVSGYTTGNLMAGSGSSSIYESIIAPKKAKINAQIDELNIQYAQESYTFEAICDYDPFLASINQVIKAKSVDMIVMGTNGATGASEVIFGSNTLQVIRSIDLPILVIPEKIVFTPLEKILFVSEYEEHFSTKAAQPFLSILGTHKVILEVLFLDNDEHGSEIERKKSLMQDVFSHIPIHFHTINNIQPDIAIECIIQLKNIDLTVKIINKESFFKRQYSGSSLDEITYHSRVPLFFMHP